MKTARENPEQYHEEGERIFNLQQEAIISKHESESLILDYLESLGCTGIDIVGNSVAFEHGGESIRVDIDSFEIGDTLSIILRNAEKYTCCGDLIEYDGDNDICPTCKEHC